MFGFHMSWNKTMATFKDNLSPHADSWQSLAESLGVDITEEEMWEELRSSVEPPDLHNVYQYMLLTRISQEVNRRHPDLHVEMFVNATDTHLYINRERITCLTDYEELVESLEFPEEA